MAPSSTNWPAQETCDRVNTDWTPSSPMEKPSTLFQSRVTGMTDVLVVKRMLPEATAGATLKLPLTLAAVSGALVLSARTVTLTVPPAAAAPSPRFEPAPCQMSFGKYQVFSLV